MIVYPEQNNPINEKINMSRREEIAENLRLSELEKAERMKSPWYRFKLMMYRRFKIVITI